MANSSLLSMVGQAGSIKGGSRSLAPRATNFGPAWLYVRVGVCTCVGAVGRMDGLALKTDDEVGAEGGETVDDMLMLSPELLLLRLKVLPNFLILLKADGGLSLDLSLGLSLRFFFVDAPMIATE